MTFEDLRNFLEKRSPHSAILDADLKIIWDKDNFFSSRTNINWPKKEDFFDKKELIISIGTNDDKIPVCVEKTALSGGETRYICTVFDNDFVTELAINSRISELFKKYFPEINDTIHIIQYNTEQCLANPLVQSEIDLLDNFKSQSNAAFNLLAVSTNLNYYFNTFSYRDSGKNIDIYKTIVDLIKKSNQLLGRNAILFTSRESARHIGVSERVFTVMFMNLVQNALAYSKPLTKVKVKVFYEDENAIISVTNEINDSSSFSDFDTSDVVKLGIGLPLVNRIATSLNGSFTTIREGKTFKAHVSLPLYVESELDKSMLKSKPVEFITQNMSYIKRYLNRFAEK
ncbi:MAG: GHKL domain-containing protein [Oscillospiraceae bacterium]|nr:GHKL domain-containing protein [Oscillospiraceae bacterium]